MSHVARVFQIGRSQAVRLPAAFRFSTPEVYIRRDPVTGDVILSTRPKDWEGVLAAASRVREKGHAFLAERADAPAQGRPGN